MWHSLALLLFLAVTPIAQARTLAGEGGGAGEVVAARTLAGEGGGAGEVLARAEPRIEDLHVTRQNGRILVSFRLLDALDEEMRERVQSGLPTELGFTLRLEHPRVWWFDKVFERATLQVVAMYNAVTREYLVNYKLDGRLIESRVVTDLDQLERAMTLIHSLPAFEIQEELPPPRIQVTVRAQLGSKPFLLLFPNQVDTGWARSWLGEPLPPPAE